MAFLCQLLRHLRGQVVVIWDGGPNHQRPLIRRFLNRNRRLRRVRLPAYSPDRNLVEAVGSGLKAGRLANFAPADIPALDEWTVEYLMDVKFDHDLLKALWERSDLPFPTKPDQK